MTKFWIIMGEIFDAVDLILTRHQVINPATHILPFLIGCFCTWVVISVGVTFCYFGLDLCPLNYIPVACTLLQFVTVLVASLYVTLILFGMAMWHHKRRKACIRNRTVE